MVFIFLIAGVPGSVGDPQGITIRKQEAEVSGSPGNVSKAQKGQEPA